MPASPTLCPLAGSPGGLQAFSRTGCGGRCSGSLPESLGNNSSLYPALSLRGPALNTPYALGSPLRLLLWHTSLQMGK